MRIYCPVKYILKNTITLCDKDEIHHISSVMRLKEGESLFVFDGKSQEYECVIRKISRERIDLGILKRKKFLSPKGMRVCLACALPKKGKFDYIIEKVTELGAERIIPLKTERTIVALSSQKHASRLARWQAIIQEASKQCGRIRFPQIDPVCGFKEALHKAKEYDLALIPYLGADTKDINHALSQNNIHSVIVFIGPEGDFTEKEVRLAKEHGCIGVSLGDTILKVDTAAIAVVSFLRLKYYSNENL